MCGPAAQGFVGAKIFGPAFQLLAPVWICLLFYIYVGIVLRRRGLTLTSAFGLRLSRPWPGLRLLTFTLVLLAVARSLGRIATLASEHFGRERPWTSMVTEGLVTGSQVEIWVTVLVAVVAAPLGEELLFRGVIYGSLRTRLGPLASATISAVLFSLIHGYEPLSSIHVFVLGFTSALIYERSRSLIPCMLAHATYNGIVVAANLLLMRPGA
jgi:uncharacterized protein